MAVLNRKSEVLIRSLSTRHGRKNSDLCLCDGPRASSEILKLRPDLIRNVYLREGSEFSFDYPVDPVRLPAAEFDRICNTVHSQGILLVLKRPETIPPEEKITSPFIFLLDRVADPGNFGTMVRTARAVGLPEVFLTAGSVDPYSDKCIRSASGAQFALKVRSCGPLEQALETFAKQGYPRVYRTAPAEGSDVFHEKDLFAKTVIILGNEGSGVQALPNACDLNIPMPGDAESLNVAQAATVILFEYVRRHFSGGSSS